MNSTAPRPAMNEADILQLRITLSDRFRLLRSIATGGMAEIFLARQMALPGFEKDVAVKLLRDRYLRDPRVVEMFMNEARIGAVLQHQNIVHFYEVGEHDKQPFIAMEYIHGEELSQLCRRGLELARFLPLEHAVDLIRQAAEAMGYFHAKRGEGGQPLEIVHRDISPSNLLVTQDGLLKVIDFGIARASFPDKREGDAADKLVPGKYNYMSPEQVRGERVDHRSDIFSLGVVLYEITVGKRLFKGRPEEVMQKIVRGRIKPPTFIRRQFPPALERIVMRTLETHRDDRYATAYELANDLEEFLRDSGLRSGPVRIAQYLDELRTLEGGDRRPELIIAGEAWLDDDGEEAQDFDRGFSLSPKPVARAPATPVPVPLVAPPSAPVPLIDAVPAFAPVEKVEPMAVALEAIPVPTETAPLRAVPRAGDEDMTSVEGMPRAAEPEIDPDLGEDSPTDANLALPELGDAPVEEDRVPLTIPILLAEPTGPLPLPAVTSRVPLAPVPIASAVPWAISSGHREATTEPGGIPLRAEKTGKVTLVPPPPPAAKAPVPPSMLSPAGRAAAEAARLAALDSASATDTPLPPIPDPMSLDDTARHPLAEPMLDGFSGLRMFRAELPRPTLPPPLPETPGIDDDMAQTTDLGTADSLAETPPPVPTRRQNGNQNGKKTSKKNAKPRPRYRPSGRLNLELTPDLVAPTSFGEGLIAKRRKSSLPWPVIIGAILAVALLLLLMTR